MPPPTGRSASLIQARHDLLQIEDSVDMDHVNGYMQKNLQKWRGKVKKATTPKDLATHMRELRQCMLDEYQGRTLFGRGYAKGAELHAQWRLASTQSDVTVEALQALLLELWRSYVLTKPNDTFSTAPSRPAPAKRADKPAPFSSASFMSDRDSAAASDRGKSPPITIDVDAPTKPAPRPQKVPGQAAAAARGEQVESMVEMGFGRAEVERALKLSGGDADRAVEQLTQTAAPDTHVTPQSKAGVSSVASSAAQRRPQSDASAVKEEDETDDLVSDVRQSGMGRRRLVKGGSAESLVGSARAASGGFPERKVDPNLTWKEAERWPLEQILPLMGAKLELWWAGNRRWFSGKVADIDRTSGKVLVKYMDGDWKWHKLWQEAIREVKLKQPKLPKLPPAAAPAQPGGAFRSLGDADEPAVPSEQKRAKKRSLPVSAPATAQGAQAARPAKQATAARSASQPTKVVRQNASGPYPFTAAERKAGLVRSTKPAHEEAAAARAPSSLAAEQERHQRARELASGQQHQQQARGPGLTDSKPRPVGKKTQPPRYLTEATRPCTCGTTPCCENDRCPQHDYYDAMRMTTDFGHGGMGSSRGLVRFFEGLP